jgi:hypothetical protein
MPGIGLINEKPLHASLKQWYARPGDRFEVPVDGFVIDIVRDDLLIEIQTRNFASINSKLCKLTRSYEVRLVYPVVTFVPDGLQSFTTKDLATIADTRRDLAQKMAYCLRHARMIELIGRQGRANLYRVANRQ